MPTATVPLKDPRLAAFLAWLIPGAGHLYQGRVGKGILYFVCILGLYFTGLAMGNWQVVYWRWVNPLRDSEQFCLNYLGQFFAGLPALPALIQATLKHYHHAPILWGFLAEPSQVELRGLYGVGKFVELGYLSTTVAGLLNILAIYDAYEGPAHVEEDKPEPVAAPAKGDIIIEVGASS